MTTKHNRINQKENAVTDQTTTPSFAEHFARAAEHYVPEVHISDEGDEPLAVEHIEYCAERLREFAGQNTGELQVPTYFEYLAADGKQRGASLDDADTETLTAGLAHLAAQHAALHRELSRVAEQGIAMLRLLDRSPDQP